MQICMYDCRDNMDLHIQPPHIWHACQLKTTALRNSGFVAPNQSSYLAMYMRKELLAVICIDEPVTVWYRMCCSSVLSRHLYSQALKPPCMDE